MATILRVGLTGGIGAGKSTVAGLLDGPLFLVIDADRLGHDELEDPAAQEAIVAALGSHILDSTGRINRGALGRLVFARPAARSTLEAILHPRIRAAEEARIAAWGVAEGIAVTEAALLVETGGNTRYDRLIVVTAPLEERYARLARRGTSRGDAERRVASQLADAEKLAVASYVVANDGATAETAERVRTVRDLLLEDLAAKVAGLSLPDRPR
jgi:dephospho-CoA kinase